MEDLLTILRLHLTAGIGMVTYRKLLRIFGSPEAVLAAPEDRLAEVSGIGPRLAAQMVRSRDASLDRAQTQIGWAEQEGVQIIPWSSARYPLALRRIYDPPMVLYVRGEVQVRDTCAIGVVGARRCTDYGRRTAESLSEALADAGFTVVSGLAYGIDAAAHKGALRSPTGRTLAVLGSGVDVIYPAAHHELAEQVEQRGAILSEFPLGTSPAREHFPKRNRVISGVSLGVLVVEGSERSGSLITARYAVDQGKDVFALPGRAGDPLSQGPNSLIRRHHAKLVTCVDDIIEDLGSVADDHLAAAEREGAQAAGEAQRELFPPEADAPTPAEPARTRDRPGSRTKPKRGKGAVAAPPRQRPSARAQTLNSQERRLYDLLSDEPVAIDTLIVKSDMAPQEVSGTLLALEIRRLCRQLPGKRFVRLD